MRRISRRISKETRQRAARKAAATKRAKKQLRLMSDVLRLWKAGVELPDIALAKGISIDKVHELLSRSRHEETHKHADERGN